jgi:hypothetical protein
VLLGQGKRHPARAAIAHFLLYADEVARKQEIQNLPPPVAQRFEAKRPADLQRVKRRVSLAFFDQRWPHQQVQVPAFERLHQHQFGGLERLEQLQ